MAIPGLSGARQILTVSTDAGSDKLLMLGMTGTERLGRLPEYTLDMVSNVNALTGSPETIDLHALVGTKATVTLRIDSVTEMKRHWNGYVTRIQRGENFGRFVRHSATVRPWPYFMTQRRNSKIFQNKTPKDILTEVFGEYSGCEHEFRGMLPTYPTLDYCVQYDETDFNFVSRLMERFGMYYFFEHTETSHKMVVVDLNIVHLPKQIPLPVPWANSLKQSNAITSWSKFEEARAQKAVIGDYDYLASTTAIKAEKAASGGTAKVGKSELFEHSALVVQNSQKDKVTTFMPPIDPKAAAAKVVLEEAQSLQAAYSGLTNVRDVACGATFIYADPGTPADNGMYLVVEARYKMTFADHEGNDDISKAGVKPEGFRCQFICINSTSGSFKPERITPRPRIAGPQTAVVIGAAGNEIDTDKHGRIKVQFHWDRLGDKTLAAGCWVRVAQPWAGKGFGFFALPRIGHEVVVSFIDGDPDKPLVTGSVYNDTNTMTWKMADFATCTGIVTRSTKGGSETNFNELRFEDKKGSEYIWVRAEKDFYRHVKNDAFDFVEKNETVRIKVDRKTSIGGNDYTYVGKEVKTEVKADLHLTVHNDTLVNIKNVANLKVAKDLSTKIGGDWGADVTGKLAIKTTGDTAISATGGLDMKGMTVAIQGASGIKLVSGAASITLGPGGVTIDGAMVKINCGGSGGSAKAASPKAPAEATTFKDLTEGKYEDQFKDPMTKK
ncbi:MAG: type VI secretion system Vgr family protein [Aquabacterium sp.]